MIGGIKMSEKKPIFTPGSEKEVTRAIVDGFAKQFIFPPQNG